MPSSMLTSMLTSTQELILARLEASLQAPKLVAVALLAWMLASLQVLESLEASARALTSAAALTSASARALETLRAPLLASMLVAALALALAGTGAEVFQVMRPGSVATVMGL